jgi:hypothetical protein
VSLIGRMAGNCAYGDRPTKLLQIPSQVRVLGVTGDRRDRVGQAELRVVPFAGKLIQYLVQELACRPGEPGD